MSIHREISFFSFWLGFTHTSTHNTHTKHTSFTQTSSSKPVKYRKTCRVHKNRLCGDCGTCNRCDLCDCRAKKPFARENHSCRKHNEKLCELCESCRLCDECGCPKAPPPPSSIVLRPMDDLPGYRDEDNGVQEFLKPQEREFAEESAHFFSDLTNFATVFRRLPFTERVQSSLFLFCSLCLCAQLQQ